MRVPSLSPTYPAKRTSSGAWIQVGVTPGRPALLSRSLIAPYLRNERINLSVAVAHPY